MELGEKLKELNMSVDEIQRLTKAFKDEKFRKMLHEYAEEISDPENRRIYEEEIAILEQERGNSIEFIHPQPFRALKTILNRKQKCYINICGNEKVGKPECKCGVSDDGRRGQCWSLPHNLSQGRQDTDPKGNKITIYDVVFHPDTLHIANKNSKFMEMVSSTAVKAIQDAFKVTLDENNMKEMKTKYKGMPHPCVIRKRIPGFKPTDPQDHPLAFPYPDEKPPKEITPDPKPRSYVIQPEKIKKHSEPSYTVKYRSFIDLQDFRCSRDSAKSPRPKEIIVTIDVPLLKSVADVNLEVKEKSLLLESESPAYRLELPLSYPVDEEEGEAKFSKQKGQLTVTLPVLPSHEATEFFAQRAGDHDRTEGDMEEENNQMEGRESQSQDGEVKLKKENEDPMKEEEKLKEDAIGKKVELKEKTTVQEQKKNEEKMYEKGSHEVEENMQETQQLISHQDLHRDPVRNEGAPQKIDTENENPARVDLLQTSPERESPVVTFETCSDVEDAAADSCSESPVPIYDNGSNMGENTQEPQELISHENRSRDSVKNEDVPQKMDSEEENPASLDLLQTSSEKQSPVVTFEASGDVEDVAADSCSESPVPIYDNGSNMGENTQEPQELISHENRSRDSVKNEDVPQKMDSEEENPASLDLLQTSSEKQSPVVTFEASGDVEDAAADSCSESPVPIYDNGSNMGENTQEPQELISHENRSRDSVKNEDVPQKMDSEEENPASLDLLQTSSEKQSPVVTFEASGDVEDAAVDSCSESESPAQVVDASMQETAKEKMEIDSCQDSVLENYIDESNRTPAQEEAPSVGGSASHPAKESTLLSAEDLDKMEEKPKPDKKQPLVLLREINKDGKVTVVSDHSTSAGFVFHNSLMYELD
ncbi:protein kintoun [Nerophis ophidion]|uniref:protein kintoun n=1 Tax=Nerophis ophidion TaxID=159077 RepID=UPI002AE04D9B|nr:protein kintoun [Nerophis ophidion]